MAGTCRRRRHAPAICLPGFSSNSAQLGETRKKETSRPFDSSMSYPIDSSVVHINSAPRPIEREREGSYRSSDFTVDIVTATGYRVDWDVPGDRVRNLRAMKFMSEHGYQIQSVPICGSFLSRNRRTWNLYLIPVCNSHLYP